MLRKVIVGHRGALAKKYGETAFKRQIVPALEELREADQSRGVESVLAWIDVKERRAVKSAIDRAAKGAYFLCLIGSDDVLPHQRLNNPPAEHGEADIDPFVPSDLPYACEGKYSLDPGKFTAPIRCVGRIPDLRGGRDPKPLVAAIRAAARAEPHSKDLELLALSAAPLMRSAELLLQRASGKKLRVLPCPEEAADTDRLAEKLHFYKCHGDTETPVFTGGNGPGGPRAVSSGDLLQVNLQNVVVAATCCYGAELYDPLGQGATEAPPPISNAYFAKGAIGFFGSTNLSWASDDSIENADLIVLDFLKAVMRGATLGEAALTAQQRFVSASLPSFDPLELKTLGQFILLGDPSVRPVDSSEIRERTAPVARRRLQQTFHATAVGRGVGVPVPSKAKKLPQKVKKQLEELKKQTGHKEVKLATYQPKGGRAYRRAIAEAGGPEATHLLVAKTPGKKGATVYVVHELGGEVAGIKRLVRAH